MLLVDDCQQMGTIKEYKQRQTKCDCLPPCFSQLSCLRVSTFVLAPPSACLFSVCTGLPLCLHVHMVSPVWISSWSWLR